MPVTSNGTAFPTAQEELQARLADPRTVDSLNRLLDRLDVVAAGVEMLDEFLHRSSDVADNLSASFEELREKESVSVIDLLGKLPKLAHAGSKMADVTASPSFDRLLASGLLERLAEPGTIESLTKLLDKLDVLAFTVESLDEFWRRGDVVANSIADSVADLRKVSVPGSANLLEHLPDLASAGVQFAEAAQTPEFANCMALLKELGKPEIMAKLRELLTKLDLVVFTVDAADGFLRRGGEVADSISEGIGDARGLSSSFNPAEIQRIIKEAPRLLEAGHQLIASGLLDKMSELANAGMLLSNAGFFEPDVVKPLAELGRRMTESYAAAKSAPLKKYGLFDLLRLLKEPEIQRSLNIAIEMAKNVGRNPA